jgi:hypothetical protein
MTVLTAVLSGPLALLALMAFSMLNRPRRPFGGRALLFLSSGSCLPPRLPGLWRRRFGCSTGSALARAANSRLISPLTFARFLPEPA